MHDMVRMREKLEKKARIKKIIGYILVGWNGLAIALLISPLLKGEVEVDVFVTGLVFFGVFIAFGALFLNSGFKNNKTLSALSDYRSRLLGMKSAQLVDYAAIADVMKRNDITVKKEVDALIRANLWEFVYGGDEEVRNRANNEFSATMEVKCQSCNNTVVVNIEDLDAKCPYCRNSLIKEMHEAIRARQA